MVVGGHTNHPNGEATAQKDVLRGASIERKAKEDLQRPVDCMQEQIKE